MSEHRLCIAACVLAAGQSRRMGKDNKLMATLNGRTLLQHVLYAIQGSAIDETIVIAGYQSKSVSESLAAFDVEIVTNEKYSLGLSSSIKAGIEKLGEHVDAVLIFLGDMPFISAKTINQIIAAFETSSKIIVPTCLGHDGNPLLWPKSSFDQLINLEGDQGAKYLLKACPEKVNRLDVENIGIVLDVDDSPTLEMLRAKFKF